MFAFVFFWGVCFFEFPRFGFVWFLFPLPLVHFLRDIIYIYIVYFCTFVCFFSSLRITDPYPSLGSKDLAIYSSDFHCAPGRAWERTKPQYAKKCQEIHHPEDNCHILPKHTKPRTQINKHQDQISAMDCKKRGNSYLRSSFPRLSYILRARPLDWVPVPGEEWPAYLGRQQIHQVVYFCCPLDLTNPPKKWKDPKEKWRTVHFPEDFLLDRVGDPRMEHHGSIPGERWHKKWNLRLQENQMLLPTPLK